MSREIKFRVPHYKRDGSFYGFAYWGRLEKDSFSSPSTITGAMDTKGDEQYTGLKDSGGFPIYEGDICSYGEGNPVREVVFEEACFCFNSISLYESLDYGLRVLGNIHQNPELLEANNEYTP